MTFHVNQLFSMKYKKMLSATNFAWHIMKVVQTTQSERGSCNLYLNTVEAKISLQKLQQFQDH